MGLKEEAAKPGEEARQAAIALLGSVLKRRQPFDEAFEGMTASGRFSKLDPRDRSFCHALAATALRRKGEIEAVFAEYLAKPLPRSAGTTDLILLTGAAQILFMEVPAHAAIDLAVEIAHKDRDARHFAKLVNAVLRRVAREGKALAETLDGARLNTPDWLWNRWRNTYGEVTAHNIAAAHQREAPLDLSAKSDPALWAKRLGGVLLPAGTIRLTETHGAIEDMSGFRDGAWWVQDAASRLPALLLGDVAGRSVADLCAAPGGKTAQLAAAGARVTAIDKSSLRLKRLTDNLARLDFAAETIVADAADFEPAAPFDAVLLDAPCSATGTIRRHPDLPYIKDDTHISRLASIQTRLLDHAATLVRTGGIIVFCTCSLEPEEGENQADRFLRTHPDFTRLPIAAAEIAGERQFINADGDLRTVPAMRIGGEIGLDGFFAARFLRGSEKLAVLRPEIRPYA